MVPILYGHKDSGHCYKIAMAARLAGIAYQPAYVDIFVPVEQRPATFLRDAAYREVPTWAEDGQTLAQSNAILLHLARQAPQVLGGVDEREQSQIEQWLFWEMSRLNLGVANYREQKLFVANADPAIVAHYEQRSVKALGQLDAHLEKRAFLLERLTIADLSCASYLLLLDGRLLDMAQWPQVARWLDELRARVTPLQAFLKEFSA
jgi:glutathione S-transferase